MNNKRPPFEITNTMICTVAEIAELVGRLTAASQLSMNPTPRRANRIPTIHGSLAIEQNILRLEQVTAALNGKQVPAPPKDIAEGKNARAIYERPEGLASYSADDLLADHGVMTRGLCGVSAATANRTLSGLTGDGKLVKCHEGGHWVFFPNKTFGKSTI